MLFFFYLYRCITAYTLYLFLKLIYQSLQRIARRRENNRITYRCHRTRSLSAFFRIHGTGWKIKEVCHRQFHIHSRRWDDLGPYDALGNFYQAVLCMRQRCLLCTFATHY